MVSERFTHWAARITSLVALLALAAGMARGGEVKIEGPKEAKRDKMFDLKVTDVPEKAAVTWRIDRADRQKLDVRRSGKQNEVATIVGAPGTYTVEVMVIQLTADGTTKIDEGEHTFVITEGDAPPPGPTPPGPVPPGPETQLQKAVRDAYATETDAGRAKHAAALASVYRAAAKAVLEQKPATMGAVWKGIEAGAKAAGVGGKVMAVQRVIQGEWKRLPQKSSEALDDTKRANIAAVFDEVALALERLQPKGGK